MRTLFKALGPSVFLSLALVVFAVPIHAQPATSEGLKAEITGVTILENRRSVVIFKISDAQGRPLDRSDLGEIRFTIAKVQAGAQGQPAYSNYVLFKVPGREYVYKGERKNPALADTLQPDYDRDGTFARLKPGVFTYTFKTALPENYDRKATLVVGGELTRESRKHVVNPLYAFVPEKGRVKPPESTVATAACNNCHDPLKPHGGLRRETGYCVLCHTSQLADPESAENLDFKVLVHKIHRGKNLPSVKGGKPFVVVGNRQNVFDFSTVGLPQDIRNCQTCHAGPAAASWMNRPAIAPCLSCHDNLDAETGKNHAGGPLVEGTCGGCHQPKGEEFDLSVAGAHADPLKSNRLAGVVFDILKIEGGKPGDRPAVTFTVKDKKGQPVDISKMENMRLVVAWPTGDYRVAVEEDVRKAPAEGNGVYTYAFRYAIPAEAKGSGGIAIQGYKEYDLKRGNGKIIKGVRDVGLNVVKYFPITDAAAVPRRTVVKTANCNACHETLMAHGETRRVTEYCVFCHNATQTDEAKRKTAKGPMPPVNIHFKLLIHKLHTGEELGEPYVIYGGPPASPGPIDLGEVRFPGDRRNCAKCHEKGTYELPLSPGVLATAVPQADGSLKNLPPITAVCGSCHTKDPAKAHIETQLASGGRESCAVCHAAGREFSVSKSHRR
ncbi:MAG TPA: OmcA/MtrC family decaheme c-type cytochrome [Candidatus Binatia bacterium]